jgi:hypothetical protein
LLVGLLSLGIDCLARNHRHKEATKGTSPLGKKIVATTKIKPYVMSLKLSANRKISGKNVTETAPTMGPVSVPLPPKMTAKIMFRD